MARPRVSPGKMALQALTSLAVAVVLVGAATLLRLALASQLGSLSPFMLYVGAVLLAGLTRGALCGLVVMLAGGVVGFRLFVTPYDVPAAAGVAALMLFWGVSAPVLITANELRVQLRTAMDRLSAAIARNTGAHS